MTIYNNTPTNFNEKNIIKKIDPKHEFYTLSRFTSGKEKYLNFFITRGIIKRTHVCDICSAVMKLTRIRRETNGIFYDVEVELVGNHIFRKTLYTDSVLTVIQTLF